VDKAEAPAEDVGMHPRRRRLPGPHRTRGELRVSGLVVLVGIVAIGLGSGAAYYHYKQPRLAAALAAELAAAPTTAEGRVQQWELSMAPNVHHRITRVGRFSAERPWLVTHAVRGPSGGLVFHGLDLERLPERLTRPEGMAVVVDLPAPVALGPGELDPESARFVPVLDADLPPSEAAARLRGQVVWLLDRLPEALAHDIEGARIEVRVGGPETAQPDGSSGR